MQITNQQTKELNNNKKSIIPGLLVSTVVAIISMYLAKFLPQLGAASIAIFLGMIVGNLFLNQEVFKEGYKFSESNLLSYSVKYLLSSSSLTLFLQYPRHSPIW